MRIKFDMSLAHKLHEISYFLLRVAIQLIQGKSSSSIIYSFDLSSIVTFISHLTIWSWIYHVELCITSFFKGCWERYLFLDSHIFMGNAGCTSSVAQSLYRHTHMGVDPTCRVHRSSEMPCTNTIQKGLCTRYFSIFILSTGKS